MAGERRRLGRRLGGRPVLLGMRVRAFVQEHGPPTNWEIDIDDEQYMTVHLTCADGATVSLGGKP